MDATPDTIPDDIRQRAVELDQKMWMVQTHREAIALLSIALLSERERCAKIAEHRVQLAPSLAPEAVSALFAALPAAIREGSHD